MAACSLALGIAACGSSSDTDTGTAAGGATTTSAAASTTSAAPDAKLDDTLGAKFAGGTPGQKADSSNDPITIGLVEMVGGPVSNDESPVAVKAAIDYVNANLGGVDGHPIALKTCYVASSEEQGQVCGQKMLNDDSVDLILEGGLNTGGGSFHRVIDGKKPVVIMLPNPGPDLTAANSYAINAGAIASGPAYGTFLKGGSVKTVAAIANTDTQEIQKIITTPIKADGITVKTASYPVNATDLLTPLTAAGAPSADATLILTVAQPECVAGAKAADQLSLKKVFGVFLCVTDATKKALGDYPKWTYQASNLLLDGPDPTGEVAFYKAAMGQYAPAGAELGRTAQNAFAATLFASKILNDVGADNVNVQSVGEAAKKQTGPILMGPPKLKFGSVKGMPTLGGLSARFYTYDGDGKWTAASDWLNNPS
jgi:branched-chain amino acid transport system substrate-binding protein